MERSQACCSVSKLEGSQISILVSILAQYNHSLQRSVGIETYSELAPRREKSPVDLQVNIADQWSPKTVGEAVNGDTGLAPAKHNDEHPHLRLLRFSH